MKLSDPMSMLDWLAMKGGSYFKTPATIWVSMHTHRSSIVIDNVAVFLWREIGDMKGRFFFPDNYQSWERVLPK
jgi:hypothetical protein